MGATSGTFVASHGCPTFLYFARTLPNHVLGKEGDNKTDWRMKLEALLKKWRADEIEQLLLKVVAVSDHLPSHRTPICRTLDVLERLVELLRLKNRHLGNKLA